MSASNPWFWLALLSTVGLYKLELLAILLNLSALSPVIPARLRHVVSEEDHERAQEYARITAKAEILQSSVQLGVFLVFWWLGGFGWLDGLVRHWGLHEVAGGLAVFGILFAAQSLISLPFEIHSTFGIEASFGFNKTTPATFILDRLKGLILGVLVGGPLLALLLWLFMHMELAALYGWLLVSGVSLLLSFLAPRLLLPLFYKFQPLRDTGLQESIMALGRKLDFPVTEVSVVDGSRRSAKANAFFTGYGRLKRIALFDTLLQNHSHQEILAVLAHEIGHSKRRHVPRQMLLSMASSAVMFALLHFALRDPRLAAAFGVAQPSVAWGMVFFAILYEPLNTMTGWLGSWLSRKYEFEADAFAREAMGDARPLAEALTRLSRDHLSNPTPHPFYIFLHYSHPPLLQRLDALGS